MDRFAIYTDLFETDTDGFLIHIDPFPICTDRFPIHTCRKTIRITNLGFDVLADEQDRHPRQSAIYRHKSHFDFLTGIAIGVFVITFIQLW